MSGKRHLCFLLSALTESPVPLVSVEAHSLSLGESGQLLSFRRESGPAGSSWGVGVGRVKVWERASCPTT